MPAAEPEQQPATIDSALSLIEGQYPLYASHSQGAFGLVLWDAGLVLVRDFPCQFSAILGDLP